LRWDRTVDLSLSEVLLTRPRWSYLELKAGQ
jgi:hypothetical protein